VPDKVSGEVGKLSRDLLLAQGDRFCLRRPLRASTFVKSKNLPDDHAIHHRIGKLKVPVEGFRTH